MIKITLSQAMSCRNAMAQLLNLNGIEFGANQTLIEINQILQPKINGTIELLRVKTQNLFDKYNNLIKLKHITGQEAEHKLNEEIGLIQQEAAEHNKSAEINLNFKPLSMKAFEKAVVLKEIDGLTKEFTPAPALFVDLDWLFSSKEIKEEKKQVKKK